MMQTRRTVLIIDDFLPDRESYRRYLLTDPEFTYSILEEESAAGGLALCQSHKIDGILLDFLLPDLDGLEFLAELKQLLGKSFPPVIMITGQGHEDIAVKAIKNGAEDYLVKNRLTPDSLRRAMRLAIENAELRRELLESEQRFRTCVENMLDCFGIYVAMRDENGLIVDFRIEYLNAAALESNCMTKEEIGKPLCQLLPNHYESGLFEEYCQVVETGQPLIKESLIYSDNFGNQYLTRAYDVRVSKLGDGFVASWRDVTKLKREKEALRLNQERLQRMVETSPIGIGFGRSTGEILSINDALLQLLGYTREEFREQGLDWKAISPPDCAEMDRLAMEKLRQLKSVEPIEKEVIHKDGTRIPVLISATALQGEADEHVAFIVDLSERQRAELAIRQSEALFRGVFESDLIGILFWNLKGQITDANEALIRMLGYSREELQSGKVSWQDITPPEYQEVDAKKFEIWQSTGKFPPFEKEYICKDGSRIPILLGCAFLPGSRDRGVAFVLDISERQQWDREREALLAREQAARVEAETANRTKDEFLAIVSHELRSPLNAILGWAKLLQRSKFDPTTAARAIEIIERNALAQNELIEDLLDISRMIRGNLRLTLAPVNLASVVETTINSLRLSAEAKQLQLESRIEESVSQVSGDLNRLQQIVTNLLTNAIKFTPPGGRVEITLERVGTQAQIRVTDTGKGISPDFLPYVFERFYQADNTKTSSKNGLGLGLAIVRHLVELHGGTVTAASPGEGQGATFIVSLPL